jgi:hypothetical protein
MLRSNAHAQGYLLSLDRRIVKPMREMLDAQNMTLHDWIDRAMAKELCLPVPEIVERKKGGRPFKKDGRPLPPPPPGAPREPRPRYSKA